MNEIVETTYNQMTNEYIENNIYKPEFLKAIKFLNIFDIILSSYLTNEFKNKKLVIPNLSYSSSEENECDIYWNFDHVRNGFSFGNSYDLNNDDCWYVVTDGTIDTTNAWGYFRDYTNHDNIIDFTINYCLKLCEKKLIIPSTF